MDAREYSDYLYRTALPNLGIDEWDEYDSDTFVVDGAHAHKVAFSTDRGEIAVEIYEYRDPSRQIHISPPYDAIDTPDIPGAADRSIELIIVLDDEDAPIAEITADAGLQPQVTSGELDDDQRDYIVACCFAFLYAGIADDALES